jgi:hypothetical protein
MDIAGTLHTYGPISLHIIDDHKLGLTYKSRNMTFAQRVQALCNLLHHSKMRCKKVLAFDDLKNTVAALEQVCNLSKTNQKLNRRRQMYIEEGRVQLGGEHKGGVGDDNTFQADGDVEMRVD